MKPFSVTLSHSQATLIVGALTNHVNSVSSQAASLIQYIDSEYVKANKQEEFEASTTPIEQEN